ncbi:MAG: DUF4041 domain-containing protein [Corynebacterium sp.]|nr:DUF4041 domain-containing protein [Corynebacterium sp.]
MFGKKAKQENELLNRRNAELLHRIAFLEKTLQEIGGNDILAVKEAQARMTFEHQELLNSQKQILDQITAEIQESSQELQHLRSEIINLEETATLQANGLFQFEHPAEDSVRLELELTNIRKKIKEMVKSNAAVRTATAFTFNNSAAEGKRFMSRMAKMMLRAYNSEAENAIIRVKAGNLPTAKERLTKTKAQIEKLGTMIQLSISNAYHDLRIRELELAAMHLQAKAAAKEAEREERARIREETKAQAEMERERKRLEKERHHYQNAIATLREQGRTDEIQELEAELNEIQKGLDDVDYRVANIRTGYVYVISNIGSFGERMVKIGMTRRLNPFDRVSELSDASVPFNFDVHAMHFSEDAVGIEAELHRRFADRKVNRVNTRREFFYVTPAEVKQELLKVAGNILEYVDEPNAEQYRESLRIKSIEEKREQTSAAL